jgi:hypothetical protein
MDRAGLLVAVFLVAGLASCAGETAPTTTARPDGPCLDEGDRLVVGASVYVEGEAASFGYATYSRCPWFGPQPTNLAADGFFYDLDRVRVEAEPGETIQIEAPGYPGADLSAGWRAELGEAIGGAEASNLDDGRWEVAAPDDDGVYVLHLGLEWSTGEAAYAATVVVGEPVEDQPYHGT